MDTYSCNNVITYKKADPSEIIQIGDIVMLDVETSTITRAVVNNPYDLMVNSRLVVGVCIDSDNGSSIPEILDGGKSKDETRLELHGGLSDSIQTIIIESGGSGQNSREIIQVAYSGEYAVNVCGYVALGDKLCISEHAGKAKSKNYIDEDYFNSRSIGKVVKFTNNKNKVVVLLDIE